MNTRFVALGDTHYGYERTGINNKLKPIHNQRCIDGVIEFCHDYQPDQLNFVGDGLDCSPISHWSRSKKRSMEGLRLLQDIEGFNKSIITPLDQALPPTCKKIFVEGNHEYWLRMVLEDYPALDGILDLEKFLKFGERGWAFLPMGSAIRMGKWFGIHGENLGNSEAIGKKAVNDYERSIRVWHNHTYQAYTKRTSVDLSEVKNGVSVPGLCDRAPGYGKKAPNRWAHGFCWGEVYGSGYFTDHVTVITEAGFKIFGKLYAAPNTRLVSLPSNVTSISRRKKAA